MLIEIEYPLLDNNTNEDDSQNDQIQLYSHNPDYYVFSLKELYKQVKDAIAKHQRAFDSNFDQLRYQHTKKAFEKLKTWLTVIGEDNSPSLVQWLNILKDVVDQAQEDINQSLSSTIYNYLNLLAITEYNPAHPFISALEAILKKYPADLEFVRSWEIQHQAWEVEQRRQPDMSRAIIPVDQTEQSLASVVDYRDQIIGEQEQKIEELEARDREREEELKKLKATLAELSSIHCKPNMNVKNTNEDRDIAFKLIGKARVEVIDVVLSFYNNSNDLDKIFIDKIIFNLCKHDKPINDILSDIILSSQGFNASKPIKSALQNYLKPKALESKRPKINDADYMLAIHYLYKNSKYFPQNSEALEFFAAEGRKIHKKNKNLSSKR